MSTEILPGIYQHYKGDRYEVIGVGFHSETMEELVFYRALYESPKYGKDSLWVRPKSMFLETVEHNRQEVQRFTRIQ